MLRRFLSRRWGSTSAPLISDAGKQLTLSFNGDETSFYSTWLRLACKTCRHETSQMIVNSQDIGTPIMKTAEIGDDELTVNFEDGHKTTLSLEMLKLHSEQTRDSKKQRRHPLRKRHSPPTKVNHSDLMSSDTTHLWNLIQAINTDGVAVITNTPNEEAICCEIAKQIGPLMQTLYVTPFDVKATPKPINIAYTGERLAYHMDLPYYESPPGIQLLHCRQFSDEVEGGESNFLDAHAAAELLRRDHPEHFKTLCRVQAKFQKDHIQRENPAQFFYRRPHISTNSDGEVIAVFWSPPFEGNLEAPFGEHAAYYSAYNVFADIIEDKQNTTDYGYHFRLAEGEVVLFNNRRLLHGREAFKLGDGHRHLQGCYISIDDFLNKYHNLSLVHANDSTVAHSVGNGDHF
eukprot:TRINITY_DN150_c6_g1_i1.p1 TRINITY_DN150_c6_g1~~TRINITY_DN150_c6_g1_i1.p1  ORF type:complete len:427 (+),score=75.39 TRINITY_DN150_c6_g1_i1:74-1282(+)